MCAFLIMIQIYNKYMIQKSINVKNFYFYYIDNLYTFVFMKDDTRIIVDLKTVEFKKAFKNKCTESDRNMNQVVRELAKEFINKK